jgi:hypothetical protein
MTSYFFKIVANQLWANFQATLILWMRPRNMNKEKSKQYFDTALLMDPKCNNQFWQVW